MSATAFSSWAILELMGHRQRAGLVQEVELFGGKLLRIDIPLAADIPLPLVVAAEPAQEARSAQETVDGHRPDREPGKGATGMEEYVSEFYGAGSIYALRPVTEDVARAYAERFGDPRPVRPVGFRLEDRRFDAGEDPDDIGIDDEI